MPLFAPAAGAEEAKNDVKGLFLLTDYPAVTLRPGTTSSVNLKLQNYALPPERLALSVSGVPSGLDRDPARRRPAGRGGAAGDQCQRLARAAPRRAEGGAGRHHQPDRHGQGADHRRLAADRGDARHRPAGQAHAQPAAAGTARHLEIDLRVPARDQERERQEAHWSSLSAHAPQNFDATFTEQYGSQELNALPLDAGQSKDVKLKVRPPNTVGAGKYKVTAKVTAEDATVTTELVLDITGQPKIDIAGREGVLSARASAGKETSIPVVLTNSGTAAAEQIELSGSGPSGWKIKFEPKTVDRIAPNENKEVQALITPTDKAIAGDYVTTVRAAARGESASQTFRVAVTTSTLWGIVGVGIIGVALLVMVGAVVRFGRR